MSHLDILKMKTKGLEMFSQPIEVLHWLKEVESIAASMDYKDGFKENQMTRIKDKDEDKITIEDKKTKEKDKEMVRIMEKILTMTCIASGITRMQTHCTKQLRVTSRREKLMNGTSLV